MWPTSSSIQRSGIGRIGVATLALLTAFAFLVSAGASPAFAVPGDESFSVRMVEQEIHGYDFENGLAVDVAIDDPSNGPGADWEDTRTAAPAPWDPAQTFVYFEPYLDGFTIEPGFLVTMSQVVDEFTTIVKTHTVSSLQVTSADAAADTVTGTGDDGEEIHVHIWDEFGTSRYVTVSGGTWAADFSAGPDTFDLVKGTQGEAVDPDADGDSTQWYWWIPNPRFGVDPAGGFFGGEDWLPNTELTVTVDSGAGPLPLPGGPLETNHRGSVDHGWDPAELQLLPGDLVTVTDGESTKTHIVTTLTIEAVDPAADTVSGIATPNGTFDIWIHDTGINRTVTAAADGSWTVNFTGEHDLVPGSNGNSAECDTDGDCTSAGWWVPNPSFGVYPADSSIEGWEWLPDTELTITVDQGAGPITLPGGPFVTDGNGNFGTGWNSADLALVPDDVVTVSDGVTTKAHAVTPLAITNIDVAADTISGAATPDGSFDIWIHDVEIGRTVDVDAAGNWTVDFSGEHDLVPGDNGNSNECDEDGDCTFAGWWIRNPNFTAEPGNEQLWGGEWLANTELTITVGGSPVPGGPYYTDDWGNFGFGWDMAELDLQPGNLVAVSDGEFAKSHSITNLTVTSADPAADTVSGTAEAGAKVFVDTGGAEGRAVTADAGGNWVVDFSVPGPNGEGTFDLVPGTEGSATECDTDGDCTYVYWRILNAQFNVYPAESNLDGNDWPGDTSLTITVDQGAGPITLPGGQFVTDGNGNFGAGWDSAALQLAPGDTVTVADGGTTKVHSVTQLAITGVDPDTEEVHGTASPDGEVNVWLHDGSAWRTVIADGSGNWTALFTEAGSDNPAEQGTADLEPGSEGGANECDADGDCTSANWWVANPSFGVYPHDDGLWGEQWTPDSTVTVTIGGVEHSTLPTDSGGNFGDGWDPLGTDIVAGMEIVVTDGASTKTHMVTELAITAIDLDLDTISGVATANGSIDLWIHDTGINRTIDVDADGTWLVDFSAEYDLVAGTNGNSNECDEDGDCTYASWYVAFPSFYVDPGGESIWGDQWEPNHQVAITVNGSDAPGSPFPTDGDGSFWSGWDRGDLDLEAGDHVVVTDGTWTKDHQVTVLTVTNVDPDENTVSGIATPDAAIWVDVHDTGGIGRTVVADGSGAWTVDFDDPNDDGGTFDLEPGTEGYANEPDADQDATFAGWRVPAARVNVDPGGDWVWGHEWLPEAFVDVTINGVPHSTLATDHEGNFGDGWDPLGTDIVAGMEIVVTDGASTKTHMVTELAITGVDHTSDSVHGTAAPESSFDIWVHQTGQGMTVSADGAGNWTADFTDSGGIAADFDGNSAQCDEDGDCTFAGWHVPPTVHVSKTASQAEVYEPGELVAFTVVVTNEGPHLAIALEALLDTAFGDLTLEGCEVPFWLNPGETYTCSYDVFMAGTGSLTNTVTAQWTDEWGWYAETEASATVTLVAPAISVIKTTADDYGNEGDGIGILVGDPVTWHYLVSNDGDVPVIDIAVADDKLGPICVIGLLDPGELALCTAKSIAEPDGYVNTAMVTGTAVDADGDSMAVEDSDESSYHGLSPAYVTDGERCPLDGFRLIFTPDVPNGPNRYKLSASNPGHVVLTGFATGEIGETIGLEVPYPFVTHGADSLDIYPGVTVGGGPCFSPLGGSVSPAVSLALEDYSDTNGDGIVGIGDVFTLQVPARDGFNYLALGLKYGLKGSNGWSRTTADALNDPAINPGLAGVEILDAREYTFGVAGAGSATIHNENTFKKLRGFGGLVLEAVTEDPVEGAVVELRRKGNVIEIMVSDEHGWYMSEYVHKGTRAKYKLVLLDSGGQPSQTQLVIVGRNVKFGEANFYF